jgi:serine protease Do
MDNNKEKSEHGFVKVSSNSKNTETSHNKVNKTKNSTFKVVVTSFISGIVGASLVLGLCFYVPAVRNIFISSDSDDTKKEVSKIFTSEGSVNKGVSIEDYSSTAISVANKVLPSVVGIEVDFSVSANYPTFSAATQSSTSKATGSGVIISKDGYILTNNHIIDTSSTTTSKYYTVSDANKVLVYLYEEDNPVEAKIIGSDSVTDLAILKIDRNDLTPVEIGDSDSVQVGEFAMAIGNPLDMRNTVTSGIISGVNREIEDDNGTMYTLIQTDAAINAGNSGGALVNAEGKLIGINTLKMSGTGIEGMGFAIPINSTLDISEQLISTGKVKRPYIGISGTDVSETLSEYYNIPVGVYVRSIQSDGPAKSSDLKPGDVIVKFNGEKIETMSQLNKKKNDCKIGDEVTLTVSRGGEEVDVKVTLTEQP